MKLKRIFSCLTAAAIAVSAIAITVNTSAEQNEVSLTYNLRNNSINSETYAKLTVVNLYESSIISKASWTADDKWVTLTDEDGNAYQKQVAGIDTGYITFGTDNGFITGGGIYNKEGLRIGVSEPCGEMVEFEFTARPYRDKVNEIEEKYQTLKVTNDINNIDGARYDATLGGATYNMCISKDGTYGYFDLRKYDLFTLGYSTEENADAVGIKPVTEETYGLRDCTAKITYKIPNTVQLNTPDSVADYLTTMGIFTEQDMEDVFKNTFGCSLYDNVQMSAKVFAEGFWDSKSYCKKGVISCDTSLMSAPTTVAICDFAGNISDDKEFCSPDGITVNVEDQESVLEAIFGQNWLDLVAAGKKISFTISILDEVSDTDKALVEASLSQNQTIGVIFDISLAKIIDSSSTEVTECSKPISFRIDVPADIIAEDRTYSVVRVHDGKAENIGGTFDSESNTITVSSDKFSTYAIVYDEASVEEPVPEPDVEPVVYYSITSDRNVRTSLSSASAGTTVTIDVDFGYDAIVYCNGTRIARITDRGTFVMPAGNVRIATEANGYLAMIKKAAPNSYIFVYDSEMNHIKTNGSRKGIVGEGTITVKLGEEYAGMTVTLYKGRKSTAVELDSAVLDANGNATFTVEGGKNYTAVVE